MRVRLVLLIASVVLAMGCTPNIANAIEVDYLLTDANGDEISEGYSGDAETLQQGLHIQYRCWTRNPGEEDEYVARHPLQDDQYYFSHGYYVFYGFQLEIVCLDDGTMIATSGQLAGQSAFRGTKGYALDWYGKSVPINKGVFLGGRTYQIKLSFIREKVEGGGFNAGWSTDQTVSFTMGTRPCTHEETEVVGAKDATCTEGGYTGDVVCADCGEVVQAGEAMSALGHDEEWVVVREATEDTDGLEQLICRRDGEVLDERAIPKTGKPSSGGSQAEKPSASSGSTGSGDEGTRGGSKSSGGSKGTDSGSSDDHDRDAKPGVGQHEKPDTQNGSTDPAAGGDDPRDTTAGTPASPDSPGGADAAQGGADAQAPTDGKAAQDAAHRDGADASAQARASGQELSAMGTVYRVGTAGSGDGVGQEATDAASAIDFTVTGFPLFWVLMWASIPLLVVFGFSRRAVRDAVGHKRESRLVQPGRKA